EKNCMACSETNTLRIKDRQSLSKGKSLSTTKIKLRRRGHLSYKEPETSSSLESDYIETKKKGKSISTTKITLRKRGCISYKEASKTSNSSESDYIEYSKKK
ncbi:8606_t:CDS:2, partial [Racocetra persica]